MVRPNLKVFTRGASGANTRSMPAPCLVPASISPTSPVPNSPAPTSPVRLTAPAPAPTVVGRTQRRTVTAALHRGPVVGLDHDPATGTYRLVVSLR